MDLFIYLDDSDLEPADFNKVAGPIAEAIAEYVANKPGSAELVDLRSSDSEDNDPENNDPENNELESSDESLDGLPTIGMHLSVKRPAGLKAPLNLLYGLAKQYKQEFVLGIRDNKTGETENICFFGFQEGKPDAYEVACYIGL